MIGSSSHDACTSLFQELNHLVKCVKSREQNHLTLIDYIRKMLEYKPNPTVFLDQELKQHHCFHKDLKDKEINLHLNQQQIRLKLTEQGLLDVQAVKLVQKSGARVLEICHQTIQKLKSHQDLYEYQFQRFREDMGRIQLGTDALQLANHVIAYSRNKWDQDLALFEQLLQTIQNGQREQMESMVDLRFRRIRGKIEEDKVKARKVKEEEVRVLKLRQREKQEERTRLQQKMEHAAQSQKILAKNKKRVSKFSDNVLSKLYSPMAQFSRSQFAQDMAYADEAQHRQKLIRDLKQRNKLVQTQINRFIGYSNNFQQKIRLFVLKPRPSGSSPKLNVPFRILTSRQHTYSQKKMQANYSSIQTVSELPSIKEIHRRVTSDREIGQIGEQMINLSSLGVIVQKQAVFSNNSVSQKSQNTSPKQLTVFDSTKLSGDKKRPSILSDGLPHINVCDRASLDIKKARVVVHSRQNPRVIQFGSHSKNKRQLNTPQMLVPLIQLSIPNKFSIKVGSPDQFSDGMLILKKLIKN